MKLFNRTPGNLPADLRQQVVAWLANAPAAVEGAIRPGCVFLTLQMLCDKATYDDAVSRGESYGIVLCVCVCRCYSARPRTMARSYQKGASMHGVAWCTAWGLG